ncbi:hypothetical protein SLEP1_g52875 [Rubroshorea leprosula]|uniref:Uncharacterized protein n=1 Tax=Rubroshorea leprosula TaxID=152421 RepID=A0AAV5MBG2_9ROSI|nr:hypothetical protein SLEP1_g52875 [Rubroshorea leprosula]
MNSLILRSPFKLGASNHQIPPSNSLSCFPSRENPRFAHFYRRKWIHIHRPLNVFRTGASPRPDLMSYSGWGDDGLNGELGNWGESGNWDESTKSRNFVVSYGIGHKKNLFMFFLGFACAWTISRVRVNKRIMFSAYVLIFVIGFSFGFIRGRSFSEVSASKRRSKDVFARVYREKLRNLDGFFDGFGVKVNNLRSRIQEAIDSDSVAADDLENYVNEVESMRLEASNARNVFEASINNEGNPNGFVSETHKLSSKKGKDNGEIRFEFSRFLGSLLGQRSVGSKSNKRKDNLKGKGPKAKLSNQTRGDFSVPVAQEKVFASVNNGKGVSNPASGQNSLDKSVSDQNREGKKVVDLEDGEMRLVELGESNKKSVVGEDYNYVNKRLQFVSESDRRESQYVLLNSRDFRARFKQEKTGAPFAHEKILKKSDEAFGYFVDEEKTKEEVHRERMHYEDDYFLAQNDHLCEGKINSSTSSKFVDDVVFDKYLAKANDLLSEARECLQRKHNDDRAELMLKRCAKLLSMAIAMKPMSLFAIGLLGNTYLLHGELKLYVSRKLRTLLARSDAKISEQGGRGLERLDDEFSLRDGIISVLSHVCKECEELLVKAGKKYRLALSIDGNDVRSLYNWGLALSFHAQLIADIGPEAASDADQVFLAAIDKFAAVMSRGNIYAPNALYRWGLALQQRSRLQPSNSKEEIKLLQQAMTLYQDALNLDSENLQVRQALSSCISELKYRDV